MNYSRIICGLAALLFVFRLSAQKNLVKLWETDTSLKVPESVYYDKKSDVLYFSNIDGKSNEKDSKGSIGKMDVNGKRVTVNWVTGLHAPKGMGIFEGFLYVADIDVIVVIDIKKEKIIQRIPIEGAVFLNDITIGQNGAVYVSDMKVGKVHRITNGVAEIVLESLKGVNGLLSKGTDLYLLVNGTLWKSTVDKQLIKIAEGMDESTDGLAQTKNGDFIISSWNGIIYYVRADGTKTVLLDTRAEKMNTADIGFDPNKNIIYVPTFFKNKIVAYQLK